MPFRPGLVGGHCIGVDPYYLTFKAEALGYHPEMILAVMHKAYREGGLESLARLVTDSQALIVDVKGCFSPAQAQEMGISYWRL